MADISLRTDKNRLRITNRTTTNAYDNKNRDKTLFLCGNQENNSLRERLLVSTQLYFRLTFI
jgi:hypothetical protein